MSAPIDTAYETCRRCRGAGGSCDYILGEPGAWIACASCRGTGVEQVEHPGGVA